MAIDTTPSTVATNALNALDFTSLIGGPMDAIIKAQALAARTTYEFINEVGLTTDPDTGEKKPVNVTFQYNSNGQRTTLTVPLLVILTVPSVEVSSFVIDFIANISASSSSTEETSSDTELGVDAEAEASLGIGPFSIKVKAKANYSSKQHSKAAQESKYSVEYTMNVRVEGGQSPMPAGLQTVLNILQGSNTSVSPGEMAQPFPKTINLDLANNTSANLQVVVKDAQGYYAAGTTVTLSLGEDSPFKNVIVNRGYEPSSIPISASYMSTSPYSKKLNRPKVKDPKYIVNHRVVIPYLRRFGKTIQNYGVLFNDANNVKEISGVTDSDGSVTFELIVDPDTIKQDIQSVIGVTAYVPTSDKEGEDSVRPEMFTVPYSILAPKHGTGSLIMRATPTEVTIDPGNKSETVYVTIETPEGEVAENQSIAFTIVDASDTSADVSADFDNVAETKTSDVDGKTSFEVKSKGGIDPVNDGNFILQINNDSATQVEVPITLSTTTLLDTGRNVNQPAKSEPNPNKDENK